MKKKKYLPLYYEWVEKGVIPQNGLCSCLGEDFEDLFNPFINEFATRRELFGLWGYDGREIAGFECENYGINYFDLAYTFTPLRQNIVLLMAAINGEL